ncbi:MAG: MurR/RpiR family transcriptional regulator [Butyrivibrio sp.]|nr:MurR/RpiR family transcriptional regulator [Butyrivibrio sp.]
MEQGILEELKIAMPSLSKGHKKIAHYIIENLDEAAFLTAAKIGKNIGVSESTVVRFAAAMGYDGFPGFQGAMAAAVKGRLGAASRFDIGASDMSHPRILEYVFKGDAEKIIDTLNNLDSDAFDLAVDMLAEARKIYIVAVRSAAPLGEFLAFYLRMAARDAATVTTNSSSEIFEQMINVGENDAVIGISFPRYSMRTLKALEFANNRNAKVIAITDSVHSPMNLYSSCNLFARSDMATVVDSLTAPLSLINALIVALCVRNAKTVAGRLEELNRVWNDYQITNNDEINYLDEELMKDLRGLKG